MKLLILLTSAILCCSCATVKTINPSNNHVKIEYRGKKSYCDTIPRVYSGVSYNFCLFYGEPNRHNKGHAISGVLFDTVISALADTIVIPYTAYQQIENGDIKVN